MSGEESEGRKENLDEAFACKKKPRWSLQEKPLILF